VSYMFIIKIILIFTTKLSKSANASLIFFFLCALRFEINMSYMTTINVRVDVMISILIRDYFPYFCW